MSERDRAHMRRALELAERGRGLVEPNPLVGAVLVQGERIVGEGYHHKFGTAHAEVVALGQAGAAAEQATLYVTLEPCCHQGKTPPCTGHILESGVVRVVIAMPDPFPEVSGKGIRILREAGLEVEIGCLQAEVRELNAPYLKLLETGRPYVHAKWAMTLDGKIATVTGQSQWISNEKSREHAHRFRGKVDAIVVGIETVLADDPLLSARVANNPSVGNKDPNETRPESDCLSEREVEALLQAIDSQPSYPTQEQVSYPDQLLESEPMTSGPQEILRVASRVVLDSRGRLPLESKLVQTAGKIPTLVAVTAAAPTETVDRLREAGCECLVLPASKDGVDIFVLLEDFGRRRWTNVLVEGGSAVLGSFLQAGQIDAVRVYMAPCVVGGRSALGPVGGSGLDLLAEALELGPIRVIELDGDLFLSAKMSS